jgi:hypothetical protein
MIYFVFFFLCHIHIEIYKMMIILHVACLSKYFFALSTNYGEFSVEVAIGQVGSDSGSDGSSRVNLTEIKNRVTGHVGSGFGSSTTDFCSGLGSGRVSGSYELKSSRVLGRSGSGWVGFQVIWYQVVSGFGFSRVRFFFVIFYLGSGQISGRQTLDHFQKYILANIGSRFSIMFWLIWLFK